MRAKSKKPINIIVGENIRAYREQSGYSREKFAELIGISPRFLADTETGFVGVSLTTLKRICEVLGISSDKLLWEQENISQACENATVLAQRISYINPKYYETIQDLILKQLELIALVENSDNNKKTRN